MENIMLGLVVNEIIDTEKKTNKTLSAFISKKSIIETVHLNIDESKINKNLNQCLNIVASMQTIPSHKTELLKKYQSDLTNVTHVLEQQIRSRNQNIHAQVMLLKYMALLANIQNTGEYFIQQSLDEKLDIESLKKHLSTVAIASIFYDIHHLEMLFTHDITEAINQHLPDIQNLESIIDIPVSRKRFYSTFIEQLEKLDESFSALNLYYKLICDTATIMAEIHKTQIIFIKKLNALTVLKSHFRSIFFDYIELLEEVEKTSFEFMEKSSELTLDHESFYAYFHALAKAILFYNANRPKMRFTIKELTIIRNLLPKELEFSTILMSPLSRIFACYKFLEALKKLDPSYTDLQNKCKSILNDLQNGLRVVEGDYSLEDEKILSAKALLKSSHIIADEKKENLTEAKPSRSAENVSRSWLPYLNFFSFISNTQQNSQREPSELEFAPIDPTEKEALLPNSNPVRSVPASSEISTSSLSLTQIFERIRQITLLNFNSDCPPFIDPDSPHSSHSSSSSLDTNSEHTEPALSTTDSSFSDDTDPNELYFIVIRPESECEDEDAPRLTIYEEVVQPAKKLTLFERTTELLWYYLGYQTSRSANTDTPYPISETQESFTTVSSKKT